MPGACQQLSLFPYERPLVSRFGPQFFKEAPQSPGVYVFRGRTQRVLYVGQSRNLKTRLSYYKNARPDREPRKIIRMVDQTEAIEWSVCETAEAAQVREVELIQTLNPKFNQALTSSPSYSFFGIQQGGAAIKLRLSFTSQVDGEEKFVGAFKNRGLCRRGLFALGRLFWSQTRELNSPYDFPLRLGAAMGKASELDIQDCEAAKLEGFIAGASDHLMEHAEANARNYSNSSLKLIFEADLVTISEFWTLASQMRKLREFSGTELLDPRELDANLLRMRTAARRDKIVDCAQTEVKPGESGSIT